MTNRNSQAEVGMAKAGKTWCWRRWIAASQQEIWSERLSAVPDIFWVMIEKPQRVRILAEAHSEKRSSIADLHKRFGGALVSIPIRSWMESSTAEPTRIGKCLEIIHDDAPIKIDATQFHLRIPHGLAFGSGDHGTTYMLLNALVDRKNWEKTAILDLGTGSGVLALAARLFGAKKIAATDFDAEAVKTSRQNELLNFPSATIRWSCADVKALKAANRYDLVLANLFSGILGEAAPQISNSVKLGGELWLSGILKSQREEVSAAYIRQGLEMKKAIYRGKWVMLKWIKPLTA